MENASQIIPVAPFDYVIFGATGDLTARKLLPALYHRQVDGQITEPSRIIGASRTKMDDEAFRKLAREALETFVKEDLVDEQVERFLARLHYVAVDAKSDDGWDELAKCLNEETSEGDGDTDVVRAFYFAVGPSLFGDIARRLDRFELVTLDCRVVVEKPIGRDLESARTLNDTLAEVFREDQIFRIDHFLGKETVQNLMALRFGNILYEPIWNARFINHVQITVAETVGLEDRAEYYDRAGALRDMVQNHLLQLLCLVCIEPPNHMDADALRDEKLKVLRALKPLPEEEMERLTVRGQYRAGAVNGEAVDGYLEDLGRDNSTTETFVALKAEVDNWRWAGVPFYLRTGKRMGRRLSEIVIQFRQVPHSIFGPEAGRLHANQLVIRVQPEEGIEQMLMIKDPGPGGMRLNYVPLDMSFQDVFNVRNPDAYERLILDVIRGNQTLFMRRDEVEEAWRWVDPILEAWERRKQPVLGYPAGTSGPAAATALTERDGRTWREID